ncbi:chaplin family protein [Lentzea aerocolonigenes]|uniref:chaplin family protein n=1 Tax=Lentzea aerocolonigenes TaxID=68170 RepID=UPI0005EC6ADF|nr:chaplin family protein [Lentzea aerocolonigenes]
MQTWAKRGIQSAFVTGGLLMLGTGIASAQENVNPDAAPSPVDAGVSVPVKVDQNNLGTPAKSLNVPKIDRTISTDRVTSAVPLRTAAPVAHPLIKQAADRVQGTAAQGLFRGNTVQAHVDVPINICGNAIAVLGNSEAAGDCSQDTHRDGTIVTDGQGQALAGNVVAVNHVLPVQITGNAIAAGGNATTNTTAEQVSTTGGDITTNGDKGAVSGNVVAEQGATPVQITGNGVGAVGIAAANSVAHTFASSEGDTTTSGKNSSISGNAVPIPLSPLFEVNGNSAAGAGNASTDSVQTGTAYTGGKTLTDGDPATLAGNIAEPALAGPITVDDNAAAAGGNSSATSSTVNESTAGGEKFTRGTGSTGSGNIAGAPISLPVAAGGNGGALVGNALTDHSNDATSTAGGNAFTVGDKSVLSGNIADVPPATAVDVCGNGASAGGQAAGTCENDVKSVTGGYQGNTGNDSVGSGNIVQTPLAAPAEVYGVAGTLAGQASGSADETKEVRSSGQPNTVDDKGTVSSNVVTAPTAVAAQVFGFTAGLVGNTTSDSANDTSVKAGDDPKAWGKKSSVSGNIVQAPTSTPAQVFGDGVTLVGNNATTADNATDMAAGGDAHTNGDQGSIAGNVISAPVATGSQLAGWSVGGGSNVDSAVTNDLDSVAGGDVASSANGGSVSGNLIGAQPAVSPLLPGNTVSAAGITNSDVVSDSNVVSGGDSKSQAHDASVSGNLIHVPANAVAAVYADAVAAAGNATTATDENSNTTAGGLMETDGSGPLTAREMTVPVEAAAGIVRVPVEVLGQATTTGTGADLQSTGEQEGTLRATQLKGIQLPKGVDSLMKADEVPAFHGIDQLPVNTLPSPAGLQALAGQLPTPQLPAVGQLPTQLPELPAVAQERSNLPLNGGTAGITPNVQGLPLGQVLAAAQELLPTGAAAERSLPSLPFTAPALPVPVQLPALPTERSLPALPLDGPASLSGLNLNPAQGLAPKAEERALPQLPVNAPALAMIDPANLFQTVTGSL